MGLDEQPRFFFFGFLQAFACFSCLGAARIKIFELTDPSAIGAFAAEIGKPGRRVEAIHRARDHGCQRVFTRPGRSRKDDCMRKAVVRQHLANAVNDFGIAVEVGKRHLFQILQLISRNRPAQRCASSADSLEFDRIVHNARANLVSVDLDSLQALHFIRR